MDSVDRICVCLNDYISLQPFQKLIIESLDYEKDLKLLFVSTRLTNSKKSMLMTFDCFKQPAKSKKIF